MPKTKKSIVFCHGIWADGSCFNKVIPALQAEGHEVMAAQYGLDTPEGDVATVKRTLGRVSSPAILVGHSYGGATITAGGMDDRVKGLVYIAAVAHDTGETVQGKADIGERNWDLRFVPKADIASLTVGARHYRLSREMPAIALGSTSYRCGPPC